MCAAVLAKDSHVCGEVSRYAALLGRLHAERGAAATIVLLTIAASSLASVSHGCASIFVATTSNGLFAKRGDMLENSATCCTRGQEWCTHTVNMGCVG